MTSFRATCSFFEHSWDRSLYTANLSPHLSADCSSMTTVAEGSTNHSRRLYCVLPKGENTQGPVEKCGGEVQSNLRPTVEAQINRTRGDLDTLYQYGQTETEHGEEACGRERCHACLRNRRNNARGRLVHPRQWNSSTPRSSRARATRTSSSNLLRRKRQASSSKKASTALFQ